MQDSTRTRHEHRRWMLALLALTFFALALRWYYVSTAMVYEPIRGDAREYFAYAWNLLHHGIFSDARPGSAVVIPNNYRDPGYPLLLAAWMKLLGTGAAWYAAVLLCQAVLGALTVTAATQLGQYWLPKRAAMAAGLLMAVWPHNIAIDGYLLTETLFGFLCASGLLLWGAACKQNNPYTAMAAGATLSLAALTNAMLLPFAALLGLLLAWRRPTLRRLCLILVASSLVLPACWAIRNGHLPPAAAGASSTDRALQNLVQGTRMDYHSAYRTSFFGTPNARIQARTTLAAIQAEYELLRSSPRQGAREILGRMGKHPWRYATWYLFEKPYALWNWSIQIGQGDIYPYPTANSPFRTHVAWLVLEMLCRTLNPLIMLLALASLFLVGSRRLPLATRYPCMAPDAPLISVNLLLAFATIVYSVLQSEPRYSIPFRSFEILLAFTTLARVAAWRRMRTKACERQNDTAITRR